MQPHPGEITCPKCNSNQLTAHKRGFSGGKAVIGELLLGPIGLLAGSMGSNEIIITCLNCGNQFAPGQKAKPEIKYKTLPENKVTISQVKTAKILGIVLSAICVPLTILMFAIGEIGFGIFFCIPTALFLFLAFRKVPNY